MWSLFLSRIVETQRPARGVLPLGDKATYGGAANQSEIRVSFAVPTAAVTLGVRIMCTGTGAAAVASFLAAGF
eukprot:COSAG01_NODE_2366_length_7816_cov_3.797460_5_plen_73_part_00